MTILNCLPIDLIIFIVYHKRLPGMYNSSNYQITRIFHSPNSQQDATPFTVNITYSNLCIDVEDSNIQLNYNPNALYSVSETVIFMVRESFIYIRSLDTHTGWPISSEPAVQSVSTQTLSSVILACNAATQTRDCALEVALFIKLLKILMLTDKNASNLPTIQLSLNKRFENLLHDSV